MLCDLPLAPRQLLPRPRLSLPAARFPALRIVLRSPGFTLAAVGSLAFGIAANTAFFTVVNSVFLRPLPYQHVDQLVEISSTRRVIPLDELRQARSLSGVAAYSVRNFPV